MTGPARRCEMSRPRAMSTVSAPFPCVLRESRREGNAIAKHYKQSDERMCFIQGNARNTSDAPAQSEITGYHSSQ